MSFTIWSSRTALQSIVVGAVAAAACDSEPLAPRSDYDGPASELVPPSFGEPAPDGLVPPPPRASSTPPNFGQTVTQAKAPPALGAASLIVSEDGHTAILSDPDRDRVVVVDLGSKAVQTIAFGEGEEPGRLVADGPNRVHVVLDRAGSIATIDPLTATLLKRRPVCAAPQGIARDGATLYVACTGGEVIVLPSDPAGVAPRVLVRGERDLRDIVVAGDSLLVSRLRSAEVLRIQKADGALVARAVRPASGDLEPFVGWRMVPSGSGGAVIVHQMARSAMVDVGTPGAYGSKLPCSGTVESVVTSFEPHSEDNELTVEPGVFLGEAVVPVDVARARTGGSYAVIAAGNGHTRALPQVHLIKALGPSAGWCVIQPRDSGGEPTLKLDGQAVAVAFTPDNRLAVMTREPAALHLRTLRTETWETIALGGASREDTGHAIFHSNTGGNVACVSCHPGGADDGRVWNFSSGPRRTQSLQGTLEGTAPYHWGGDAPGVETFATDVFAQRMGGQHLDPGQVNALGSWIMRIPAPLVSPAVDVDARARGKTLFESVNVGCNGCHNGAKLTNNESVDVGTGGTFQVPSLLGLGLRAPFLHDGRAPTLLDRFGAAGGGDEHGHTSDLTPAQLQDLVTYLESL
ncbi:MAG: surface antigen protein [Labilithrix sp.]|nr:surface antigen protein [Labilithrix sp.]